jgi:hypothetical protein
MTDDTTQSLSCLRAHDPETSEHRARNVGHASPAYGSAGAARTRGFHLRKLMTVTSVIASFCLRSKFPDSSPEGFALRSYRISLLPKTHLFRCFTFFLSSYVMSASFFVWRGLMDAELRHILWRNAHTRIF